MARVVHDTRWFLQPKTIFGDATQSLDGNYSPRFREVGARGMRRKGENKSIEDLVEIFVGDNLFRISGLKEEFDSLL